MSELNSPDRLRLFIALGIPAEVKERIFEALSELKSAVGEGVRWTTPEQFHLTLRFLGSVESAQVEALASALGSVCAGFKPLSLRAERIGFFPRPRSPRVVWVGVTDADNELPGLQQAVQAASDAFTKEKPETRFTGHVTLGRVKELTRFHAELLAREAERMHQAVFGTWQAREVELVRSQLSPHGSRYSVLASFPLGPSV